MKLLRVLRLLEPHDSEDVIPFRRRSWDTVPVHDAPVRFAWEPLAARGVEYSVSIGKVILDEHLYLAGAVATEMTDGHQVELDLPANEGGVLYSLHLVAFHEGEWVGRTFFRSRAGSNWNHPFRVRSR